MRAKELHDPIVIDPVDLMEEALHEFQDQVEEREGDGRETIIDLVPGSPRKDR